MIVGRDPGTVVIGDTVLSRIDHTLGAAVIVDADVPNYMVYCRRGGGKLSWHTPRELTVPRLDYTTMTVCTR